MAGSRTTITLQPKEGRSPAVQALLDRGRKLPEDIRAFREAMAAKLQSEEGGGPNSPISQFASQTADTGTAEAPFIPNPLPGMAESEKLGLDAATGGGLASMAHNLPVLLGMVKAFHGSPHSFPKFSSKAIGTGEGAQAYGHGLYFAENPGVAKEYAVTLTKTDATVGGKPLMQAFPGISNEALDGLSDFVKITDASDSTTLAAVRAKIAPLARDNPDDAVLREAFERVDRAVREVGGDTLVTATKEPKVYGVKLNVEPEDLLDWDKPLSEQSAKVREKLRRMGDVMPESKKQAFVDSTPGVSEAPPGLFAESLQTIENTTGDGLYRALVTDLGSDEAASAALREAGIPGLRYLDQGSRGAFNEVAQDFADQALRTTKTKAEAIADLVAEQKRLGADASPQIDAAIDILKGGTGQTRNLVMFDDNLIDIVSVNGKKVDKAGQEAAKAQVRAAQQSTLTDNASTVTREQNQGGAVKALLERARGGQ